MTEQELDARKAELDQYKIDIDEKNDIVSSGNEAVKIELEEKRNTLHRLIEDYTQRLEALSVREAKLCKCQK